MEVKNMKEEKKSEEKEEWKLSLEEFKFSGCLMNGS